MLRTLYGVAPSTATQALGAAVLAASRSGGRAGPAPPSAPAPALPLSFLRPPQLIGRDEALRSMRLAWRAGQTLCVTGEAGIGKSRLLAEFAAPLGECVNLAARPGDSVRPYATLTRLVSIAIDRFRPTLETESARWAARVLPGIAYLVADASATPPQTAHELQRALLGLREVLAECTRRGCATFVLDDLQFADLATIEALPALLEAPAGGAGAGEAGPRFAFGSRLDDPAAPSAQLLAALAVSRDVHVVALEPLESAQVDALIQSLALPSKRAGAFSLRIFAKVGGNPASVIESLKLALSLNDDEFDRDPALAEIPIPPGIEQVLQRRISLLGARARHIAQLAAVAGSLYNVEMAAAALACSVPELDAPLIELERRQVLRGQVFAHDLVAAAMARSIPASVAEFMHRFVAEHLQASGTNPAVVAGHWRACGEWRRAGVAYVAAAATARDAMRPRETAEFLDAAIECFGKGDDSYALFDAIDERLLVLEAPDRNMVRPGLNERLAELANSEVQRLRVLLHRYSFLGQHQQIDPLEHLLEGLQRAHALALPRLAFDFAEPAVHILASHQRFGDALVLLESFTPWLSTTSDYKLQGRQQQMLAVVSAYGDRLAESVVHAERAIALFVSAGDDLRSLPTMANVGLVLHWRGELAPARAVLERAIALRDRLHGGASGTPLDVNLAAVQRDLGEFAAAEARFREALSFLRAQRAENADEPATDIILVENHLAQLWLMIGQPERALAEMQTDDGNIDARFRSRRLTFRLRAARLLGRGTVEMDRDAAMLIGAIGSPPHRVMFELEMLRSIPAHEALSRLSTLYDEPCLMERPGLRMQVALQIAETALRVGDLATAKNWLALAAPVMSHVPPFDLNADVPWRITHDVHDACGQPALAREAERRAGNIVAEVAQHLPSDWREAYLMSRQRSSSRVSRVEPVRGGSAVPNNVRVRPSS
ncbi:MAG: AAA family ATPase [Caldimonas sp.]